MEQYLERETRLKSALFLLENIDIFLSSMPSMYRIMYRFFEIEKRYFFTNLFGHFF